jgi:hypothetical protein
MADESKPKSSIRADVLATRPSNGSAIVEVAGHRLEVRPPPIAVAQAIAKRSRDKKGRLDEARFDARLVIACTYEAGTDTKVFEVHDEEALINQPLLKDHWYQRLQREIKRFAGVKLEEVEEDFDEAPTNSSSTG